jgi:tetratricopeptide (TPR) repeat protein
MLIAGIAAVGALPCPASAQSLDSEVQREERLLAADQLYHTRRPQAALQSYSLLLEDLPDDVEILCRASRAALSAGWIEEDEPVSVGWYRQAEALARRAVSLDPESSAAHFWLAAAVGRRAQVAGGGLRSTARLADEAYREAARTLELDSLHAGAHNLLGQLHYEVMDAPWLVRVIGLRFVGRLEFEASWDEAERLLEKARTLAPDELLGRLELARLYLRTDRPELARPELEVAATLTSRQAQDEYFRSQVEAMLASLGPGSSGGGE